MECGGPAGKPGGEEEKVKRNRICRGTAFLLAAVLLAGCGKGGKQEPEPAASAASGPVSVSEAVPAEEAQVSGTEQMKELNASLVPVEPADGYGSAYEVFVYSFSDSDGDGIGDLKGLTDRLDYINDGDPSTDSDLGCNMIWLMPVFPSPTYHKYDAVNYTEIDPQYGSLGDFDQLLAACHSRGVRVILDLALNHSSTEHPWFQAAADYLRALPEGADPVKEDCPYVWYYNFSREQPKGYVPLPDSSWYYEAQFWSGMPDFNLSTEEVRQEFRKIAEFWLGKGVDGFRLDAVTSYYTDSREGSVSFLKWFVDTAKEIDPDAYLVAEAWADQNTYAEYYASGIDSMFDFAFSGDSGVIAEVVKGSRNASFFGEAMAAEEELYGSRNAAYVNAPFYTNHDMARSAGYYAYDDGSKTKLAEGLNLLMTGNAFLYYGEELGMKGSGKDENKRAPMYWSAPGEAADLCAGPPEMDSFEMKFPPFSEQAEDPSSIRTYVRDALRIRGAFPAIAKGRTEVLSALSDQEACVFRRTAEGRAPVTVLINASDAEKRISKEGLTETELAAVLLVSDAAVTETEDAFVLPPCGIAVLTGQEGEAS